MTGPSFQQVGAAPGPWVPLINQFGAVWQSTGELPPPPFDVQMTASSAAQALVAACAFCSTLLVS